MADLLDAATPKPLKIISLQAENVKRLVAVNITPKGNLVQITGRNAQGKSSVLDAIWWALAGAGNVQSAPIRKGQQKAVIKLDLGEVVITRTFAKRDDNTVATKITVENADGAQFPSPQRMIDSFLGTLAFDPLAFARMASKQQFDTLKAFVPGVDFAGLEGLNRADFDRRTAVNREIREKRAQASAIQIPETTPEKRIDEAAIVTEIGEVGEHNAMIERRKEGRTLVAKEAEDFRKAATTARDRAVELRREADALDEQATASDTEAANRELKLQNAEPLPTPKDAADVRARLDEAKRINLQVEQALRRATLLAEANDLEEQAKQITGRMEAREEEKRMSIAAASLPVDGLGFGEDCITLNGLPFEQASDAEQLRVSCAIAMASNPRLRVIRVRDGSLLDEEAITLLAKMADKNDMQVWMERVDSSGKVGFVLEDGHVRSAPGEAAAQPQAAE